MLSRWLSVAGDEDGKVLGHLALVLDGVYHCFLKLQSPLLKRLVTIESSSMPESSGPRVNTSNTVG